MGPCAAPQGLRPSRLASRCRLPPSSASARAVAAQLPSWAARVCSISWSWKASVAARRPRPVATDGAGVAVLAAGGGERQIIVDAQIRAKPDQMGGHIIPFIMKIDKFDLYLTLPQD